MKLNSPIAFFLVSTALALPQKRTPFIPNNRIASTEPLVFGNNSLLHIPEAIKGIIFGDFEAQPNTQRFNGSLAIQGNFTANGFSVNDNHTIIECNNNNATNLADYALITGGQSVVQNVTVNGAIYANHQMTDNNDSITFSNKDCFISVKNNSIPNLVNFDTLRDTSLNISQFFASQKPNMVIRDGRYISDGQFLGNNSNQDYYIFTFGRCQKHPFCVIPDYLYSSPAQIFHGGNWTGPWNSGYFLDRPIVFNIPVLAGTVFNMSTANPVAGLENAQVLFNVYPVDSTGVYNAMSQIVLFRNTTEIISGHILAPSAFIIENNQGGFDGQLIAARYLSVHQGLNSTMMLNNISASQIMATTNAPSHQ